MSDAPARRSNTRREDILRFAWQEFCANGYDAASVNQIILKLGISKGSFYHHFASKGALLNAVVAWQSQRVRDNLEDLLENNPTLCGLELFDRLLRSQWYEVGSSPELIAELSRMLMLPSNDGLRERVYQTEREILQPVIRAILTRGVNEGSFTLDDIELSAELLHEVLVSFLTRCGRRLLTGELESGDIDRQVRFLGTTLARLLGTEPRHFDPAMSEYRDFLLLIHGQFNE